jgi:hypothetical protein
VHIIDVATLFLSASAVDAVPYKRTQPAPDVLVTATAGSPLITVEEVRDQTNEAFQDSRQLQCSAWLSRRSDDHT